jgi:hypothetical protein
MSKGFKEKNNEITTAIFVPKKTSHSSATILKYCNDALHVNSVIYNHYTFKNFGMEGVDYSKIEVQVLMSLLSSCNETTWK